MISLDTSILARYIVRDAPEQAAMAERMLRQSCYVPVTVILELSWLLQSRYRMPRADIAANLEDLLALPDVMIADEDLVRWAIGRYAGGADLADMLHLVASRPALRLATFDRRLVRAAGPDSPVPVETLVA